MDMRSQMDERASHCRIFVFVVALGFVLATHFHYSRSAYHEMGYPVSTYLFKPDDRYQREMDKPLGGRHIFGDLFFVSRVMRNADPYHIDAGSGLPGPSNYPPFILVITWFFGLMPFRMAVALFFVLTFAIAGAFFCAVAGL